VLFLTALLGYLPIPNLMERLLAALATLLPSDVVTLLQDRVRQLVTEAERGCALLRDSGGALGLLQFGFLKGKSAIRSHREFLGRERNFTGLHCWARGYGVSTLGLDERVIREDIRNQENEEKRQAQMQLKGLETLSYATEGSSGPFIGVREGLEALSDHSWPPPGAFSKLPALRVVLDFLCKRLKMLLLYPGTLVFCACDTTTCTTGCRHWCH
jgi:putative transposase